MGLEGVDLNKQYVYRTKEGGLGTVSKSWGRLARTWIKLTGGDRKMERVVDTIFKTDNSELKNEFKRYINAKLDDRSTSPEVSIRFRAIKEIIDPTPSIEDLPLIPEGADLQQWTEFYVQQAIRETDYTQPEQERAALKVKEVLDEVKAGNPLRIQEVREKGLYQYFLGLAKESLESQRRNNEL